MMLNKLLVTLLSLPLLAACSVQSTPNAEDVATCRSGHEAQAEEHRSAARSALREIDGMVADIRAGEFGSDGGGDVVLAGVETIRQFGVEQIALAQKSDRQANRCD